MKRVFALVVCILALSCSDSKGTSGTDVSDIVDVATVDEVAVSPDATASLAAADDSWYQDAVFYHLWIKAFRDSDYNQIGDLQGIIDKLDYLNDGDPATTSDLGVTALWLSPVFDCAYKSDNPDDNMHGYDTTDYYQVNPYFGTIAKLRELLTEAHARGMRVIFDFVPNHTSNMHPWFLDPDAYEKYYIWRGGNPGWEQPWGGGTSWHSGANGYYYGAFWSGMPDLNFRNINVRIEMTNVAKHWLNFGFDGMRIDAARYLYEDGLNAQQDLPATHDFYKALRTVLNQYGEDHSGVRYAKIMVGEIWTGNSTVRNYFGNGSDEFTSCFDFDFAYAVRDAAQSGSVSGGLLSIQSSLESWGLGNRMSRFLSNHDNVVDRPYSYSYQSGGVALTIQAAALMLLMPGTPFLYYGNEIGMAAKSGVDKNLRADFKWDSVDAQTADPKSILSWHRYLIRARQASPALSSGSITSASVTNSSKVFAYVRSQGSDHYLVVFNRSNSVASTDVTLPSTVPASGAATMLIGDADGDTVLDGNTAAFSVNNIPGFGFRVIKLGGTAAAQIAGDLDAPSAVE